MIYFIILFVPFRILRIIRIICWNNQGILFCDDLLFSYYIKMRTQYVRKKIIISHNLFFNLFYICVLSPNWVIIFLLIALLICPICYEWVSLCDDF